VSTQVTSDARPAIAPAPGGRARTRSRHQRRPAVEIWLRTHSALVYTFLYFPILVVVLFSFNGTEHSVTDWKGFSLKWYGRVLGDPVVLSALRSSLIVATFTAIISSVAGTMAAVALQRTPRWFRNAFSALTFVSIIVPEIVIALATLVFFSTSFDLAHTLFDWKLKLGYPTIVMGLALYDISLIFLLVQARLSGIDRTYVEASYDLYATPWRTFWQVTFPQLLPAVVAGFLLSFTFSFDDYVMTSFVSGAGTTTLPLYVFGQIKQGVTPATNAVAATMLLFTLSVLGVGQFIVSRSSRRRGGGESVASIVAEQA
jgi:spermidine/putrescine transport system permease protein